MRWMAIGTLASLVLGSSLAWGNDVVCGNAVRAGCAQTTGLTRYLTSQEPSSIQAGCVVIPDDAALTQAQRTLMQSPSTHQGALFPSNYPCYLKVEGGVGVEMPLAEKQAVDVAQQALLDAAAAKSQELATNDFCNASDFAVIDAKIDQFKANNAADIATLDALGPPIDGITTVANLKPVLHQMVDDTQTVLTSLSTRYAAAFRQVMRCLFARTPTR